MRKQGDLDSALLDVLDHETWSAREPSGPPELLRGAEWAVSIAKPIPGWKAVRSGGRWLRRRFVRRAAILGYHRVSEPGWDPFDLSVSRSNFAAHLRLIRERYTPLALPSLVAGLRDGSLPEGAVTITFDDGYRDNLTHAKPLLEQYAIPATIFVVSGSLGGEVWWDRLAKLIDPSNPLPRTIRLTIDGREHEVPVQQGAVERSRRQVVNAICQLIQRLSPAQIEEALQSLAAALGEPPVVREQSLVSRDELARLADSALIEIGSHTAHHPFLADLSVREQRDEVLGGKADLEALLGRPVHSFSYPNGSVNDQTRNIVREAGFACACGSKPDVVWRHSDPFDLPRLWQANRDEEAFARRMKRFL